MIPVLILQSVLCLCDPVSCACGYLMFVILWDHFHNNIIITHSCRCFQVGEKMTLETMKAKCDEDKTCNSFSFGYIMGQSCLKTSSTPPTFPSFNCFYVKSPEVPLWFWLLLNQIWYMWWRLPRRHVLASLNVWTMCHPSRIHRVPRKSPPRRSLSARKRISAKRKS